MCMLYREDIILETKKDKVTYINITPQIKEIIEKSQITEGIVVINTAHTTCSVFLEEFTSDTDEFGDEYLQIDLNDILDNIAPPHVDEDVYNYPGEMHYQNVESWPNAEKYLPGGDRSALWNGDAHLKSTIIGASETLNVVDGELGVGSTGYIYFADFDRTRPRERTCTITIIE